MTHDALTGDYDWSSMMSDHESSESQVFDVVRIRQLIEMMKENDLSEIELRNAEQRIKLRRGADPLPPTFFASGAPMAPASMMQAPAAAPASNAPGGGTGPEEEEDPNIVLIRSPMVGTFYAKPNPEAPNFVNIGDHVTSETTVCTVEAMKMFNEIPAGVSGQIVSILADNEEPVDVNKPLFKVDTSK